MLDESIVKWPKLYQSSVRAYYGANKQHELRALFNPFNYGYLFPIHSACPFRNHLPHFIWQRDSSFLADSNVEYSSHCLPRLKTVGPSCCMQLFDQPILTDQFIVLVKSEILHKLFCTNLDDILSLATHSLLQLYLAY